MHFGGDLGNGLEPNPKPSEVDKKNAVKREKLEGIRGNNYELSAGYNKVYIYKNVNGEGKTMPLCLLMYSELIKLNNMALKYKILLTLAFLSYSCLGQVANLNQDTNSKVRYVSFVVDGKKQKIDNRFSFTIVHDNDTIQARIKGNRLIISDLQDRFPSIFLKKFIPYIPQ